VELKREETLFEIGQGSEIVRGEDLSLNNREVDLNLIEPTGMSRSMDENGVGPLGAEAVGSFLTPMSGAVVHDPEDATCRLVGLLLMTSLTRRSTGAMPFSNSHRPKTLARWTSQAAK
jgi:hypothetical protein